MQWKPQSDREWFEETEWCEKNGEKSREKRTKEGGSIVHLLRLDPKTINGRLD